MIAKNIKFDPKLHDYIERAAATIFLNFSDFVRQAALDKAKEVLGGEVPDTADTGTIKE